MQWNEAQGSERWLLNTAVDKIQIYVIILQDIYNHVQNYICKAMFLSHHIIVDCSEDQCREVKDDCSMQPCKVCKKWDNRIPKSLILEDIETKVQSKETELNVYILFAFFKAICFFFFYTRGNPQPSATSLLWHLTWLKKLFRAHAALNSLLVLDSTFWRKVCRD